MYEPMFIILSAGLWPLLRFNRFELERRITNSNQLICVLAALAVSVPICSKWEAASDVVSIVAEDQVGVVFPDWAEMRVTGILFRSVDIRHDGRHSPDPVVHDAQFR